MLSRNDSSPKYEIVHKTNYNQVFHDKTNLHFELEFTTSLSNFKQKINLPPLGVEPTALIITGLEV